MNIKLVKIHRTQGKAGLLAAMAVAAFTAVSCQDNEKTESPTVWLTPSLSVMNTMAADTRAIATGSGDAQYQTLEKDGTVVKAFAIFKSGNGGSDNVNATFRYSGTDGKWNGRMGLKPGNKQTYDVFAYSGDGTPGMASGDAMEITRIPIVTAGDPLISVASCAKNTKKFTLDFSEYLTRGRFTTDDIELPDTEKGESFDDWKIGFAMEHLYAGVVLNFSVPASDKIERVFKLKKVELTSDTPAYIDATVTFGGAGGIVVNFHNAQNAAAGYGCHATVFTDEAGEQLTDTPTEITASFLPGSVLGVEVKGIHMTSTYDVYDRAGKLVRENCTATNNINFGSTTPRGARRTYNVSIIPTYLYQMSDYDPSSPAAVFSIN